MSNTKELIDNISFKLFLERGYEATNIRDICKEVGIKPSSLYFYYPSKESIFIGLYDYVWSERIKIIKQVIEDNQNKNGNQILGTIFKSMVSGKAVNITNHKFLLRYHLFPSPEIISLVTEKYDYWTAIEYDLFKTVFLRFDDLNILAESIKIKKYYRKYKTFEHMVIGSTSISGILLSFEEIDQYWDLFSKVFNNI